LSASGFSYPEAILSSTAQMLVTFTTDESNPVKYRGFSAVYSNGGPAAIDIYNITINDIESALIYLIVARILGELH